MKNKKPNKLKCPSCKNERKFKIKTNYPFGKMAGGKVTSITCKFCKRKLKFENDKVQKNY